MNIQHLKKLSRYRDAPRNLPKAPSKPLVATGPVDTVTLSGKSRRVSRSTLAKVAGFSTGAMAALIGGVPGSVGAAAGTIIGAGVGVVSNAIQNLTIYGSGDMNLKEGAKRGAAVGAAIGGTLGAASGYGAVALAGGAGLVVLGTAAIAVVNECSDGLYQK